MRLGVILASHGEFARAALGAVEMIAGKQGDVVALGLTAEEKAAFEELIGLGVECWMQTTTRDSKEPVSELLKNY